MTHFGIRLRELRTAAGLSQARLGAKAGIHRQAVAKFEAGERDPQWRSVLALSAALGVTPDAFQQPPSADAVPRGRGRPPKSDAPTAPAKRRTGRKMPGKAKREPKGE